MSSLRPQDHNSLCRFKRAPSPHTSMPHATTEFIQHVAAGRNLSLLPRPGRDPGWRPVRNHPFPNPFRTNTYRMPASVDSKPLTQTLSPLDATLTKNRGEGLLWLTGQFDEACLSWATIGSGEISFAHDEGAHPTGGGEPTDISRNSTGAYPGEGPLIARLLELRPSGMRLFFNGHADMLQHSQVNPVNDVVRPQMPVGRWPDRVVIPRCAFEPRPPTR